MEKVKVVIIVDGGVVQAVHAGPFVEVYLVDLDDARADGANERTLDLIYGHAVGDLPEAEIK